MEAAQEMEVQMNLSNEPNNSEKDRPKWYDPTCHLYKDPQEIDFFKFHDEFNQAKIKLYLLEISGSGWQKAFYEVTNEISRLREGYEDLDLVKKELTINAIEELDKKRSLYLKRMEESSAVEDEIMKKYWPDSDRLADELFGETSSESDELDDDESDDQLEVDPVNDCELKIKSNPVISKLLDLGKSLEEPEEYSPFNDPEDDFGWKSFCNYREKLQRETIDKSKMFVDKVMFLNICNENEMKINKASIEFYKKYFLEDLSQPIYGGLAYFTDEGIKE